MIFLFLAVFYFYLKYWIKNLSGWERYAPFLKETNILLDLFILTIGSGIFYFNINHEATLLNILLFMGVLISMISVWIDTQTKFLFRILSLVSLILFSIFMMSSQSDYYISTLILIGIVFYFMPPIKGLGGGDLLFFTSFLPFMNLIHIPYYLLFASLFSFFYMKILRKTKTPLGPGIFFGVGVIEVFSFF